MFNKIINNFDINTEGWFDHPSTGSGRFATVLAATQEITDHIWSLWIKAPTIVRYEPLNAIQDASPFHAIQDFFRRVSSIEQSRPLTDQDKTRLYNNFLYNQSRGDFHISPDESSDRTDHCIIIPAAFVSNDMKDKVGDMFTLADAITGYGLEALERDNACLRISFDGLLSVHNTIKNTHLSPSISGQAHPDSVIASCILDVWYAACIKDIRTKILTNWPGWTSIFAAQDAVLLPPTEDMVNAVSRKHKNRSELRRFCMGLAWNLNAQPKQRIPFPPNFKNAYSHAFSRWPSILAAPRLDGSHFAAISSLIKELCAFLSTDEQAPARKSSTPRSGSDQLSFKAEPHENRHLHAKCGGNRATTTITPTTNNPSTATEDSDELTSPPPAVFLSPCPTSTHNIKYRRAAVQLQAKVRTRIAESITASSWYVTMPPPGEYGNLQGILDEANLFKLSAFNDPHIFSAPPEVGYGKITIAVLVDASSSMNAQIYDTIEGTLVPTHRNMHEALTFCAGLKDGLANASNVTLECFAYSTPGSDNTLTEGFTHDYPDLPNAHGYCAMRRLTTEETFLSTQPCGSTPSAVAIKAASDYLNTHHSDSTRIILHLTDGAPAASTFNPYLPAPIGRLEPRFHDSPKAVRNIISNLDIPVFGVGFGQGVDQRTMREQYDHDKWFVVNSPLEAVPVACQLITGIGQCLANR